MENGDLDDGGIVFRARSNNVTGNYPPESPASDVSGKYPPELSSFSSHEQLHYTGPSGDSNSREFSSLSLEEEGRTRVSMLVCVCACMYACIGRRYMQVNAELSKCCMRARVCVCVCVCAFMRLCMQETVHALCVCM